MMNVAKHPETLLIRGGIPLEGEVTVRGAKNLVTKAMVAALLAESPSELANVPAISDVDVVRGLLSLHGMLVEVSPAASTSGMGATLRLDPRNLNVCDPAKIDAYAGSSRIPILFCGPLLHRMGRAFIPFLGGCRIGDRPIDFHLDSLRKFGAKVEKQPEGVALSAPRGLRGAQIHLPYPSVGATEQVLLTAVLAEGTTEIRGAAIEPEIMDLVAILQKMGAVISYEPNRVFLIEGVPRLTGYRHTALSDRMESASWAAAALATRGNIFVRNARQGDLLTFLNIFRKVGGRFQVEDNGIRFWHSGGDLSPVTIETDVHPGFMTDWQQPLVVALTQARGRSVVHETVYENRFGFTEALVKMGANITLYPNGLQGTPRRVPHRSMEQAAVIVGPTPLEGTEIEVPDLRGGFSHVIAALAAQGTSVVRNAGLIGRGYEDFVERLLSLRARVELLPEPVLAASLPTSK